MSPGETAEQISSHFFTFGLIYSTLYCLTRSVVGVYRWLSVKGKPKQFVDPTADSAETFGALAEEGVERELRNRGIPTLRNVFLQDAKGRLTEIDLLALAGNKILAIEVKAWRGKIIGTPDAKEWIQVKDRGDRKVMGNPLEQNRHHLRVLRHALPGVVCEGLVVFTTGTFANAAPPGVEDVPALLTRVDLMRQSEPSDATLLGWGKLSSWSMRQDKPELQQTLIAQIQNRQAEGLPC